MKPDFSGYATKHGIKCSDGRIINRGAFDECNGSKVPLVYQHNHTDVDHVLGHALLETRNDGVYAYGFFNDTPNAQAAKKQVAHGDIQYLSIYANQLKQDGSNVIHGMIREVSLVLAGANPGARIDNLSISHGAYDEELEDEAIMYSGELIHADGGQPQQSQSAPDEGGRSIQEVFQTMTEEQKQVVYALVGMAIEEAGGEGEMEQSMEEGDDDMSHNIFETDDGIVTSTELTHDQISTIFSDAQKCGSLKESVLVHAEDYGIVDIESLFPEAKIINGNAPEWVKRKTEWVAGILNGARHSPFSRIKMHYADITADEARAKGYIKGNMKKEEFFSLSRREVGPCTIYKKQKLDRDDIIDITSFDVVAWIKAEMKMMLEEEIARAILVGDGREVDDPDKINEKCLIPIVKEDPLYAMRAEIPAGATPDEEIDALIKIMEDYEGTGTPTLYTTKKNMINYKLIKDKNGRRIYGSENEIANLIGVSKMVDVPVMKGATVDGKELVGIIVNMTDYTIGADKGGQTTFFDDFDIDYNQYKYLYETRLSGCLTKLKSAVLVLRASAGGAAARTVTPPQNTNR